MAAAPAAHPGAMLLPPDPPSQSAATVQRGNPGTRTREWKIDIQPSRSTLAFCPRCALQFERGSVRIGSAAKGGKALFHIPCVDAALPAPAAFRGWDDLTQIQQLRALEQLQAHAQDRGGAAEGHAPKRVRHGQPTRLVQMQLAFAAAPMPQEAAYANAARAAGPPPPDGAAMQVDGDMQAAADPGHAAGMGPRQEPAHVALPIEQAADEDSDLDDPEELPDLEGDPMLNMQWWDEIQWQQLVAHSAATMVEVPLRCAMQ